MIYFLCFPGGDRTRLTVIDLDDCVIHERSDWSNVNELTYYNREDAIKNGREIADRHGLIYEPFESRYDSSTDEIQDQGFLY